MYFQCLADHDLSAQERQAIARYRYEVFVETMGWQLPCEVGHEQDEFDTEHAVHIVARTAAQDRIIGYGRLVPTVQPYLLQRHFASLFNGATVPCSKEVWELSRYTSVDPSRGCAQLPSDLEFWVGKRVLLEAMRLTATRGAGSLVCCTTVGIERLARRWGVPLQRLGPPQRFDTHLLIAGQIDLTPAAFAVLGGQPPRQLEADLPATPAHGVHLHPAHLPGVPFLQPTALTA